MTTNNNQQIQTGRKSNEEEVTTIKSNEIQTEKSTQEKESDCEKAQYAQPAPAIICVQAERVSKEKSTFESSGNDGNGPSCDSSNRILEPQEFREQLLTYKFGKPNERQRAFDSIVGSHELLRIAHSNALHLLRNANRRAHELQRKLNGAP